MTTKFNWKNVNVKFWGILLALLTVMFSVGGSRLSSKADQIGENKEKGIELDGKIDLLKQKDTAIEKEQGQMLILLQSIDGKMDELDKKFDNKIDKVNEKIDRIYLQQNNPK